MRESLKGLEFRNFDEIPDFEEKLSEFLNRLDEELKHWRDYVEKGGKRSIPHPISGYACLDDDKIGAISYYILPKMFSKRYFIDLLFHPKGVETGVVTKKEYQRRGIAKHLRDLLIDIMRKKGIKRCWIRTDSNNIAMLKWVEKRGDKIVKRTNKQIYFASNLDDDDRVKKNHDNQSFERN